MIIPFWRRAAAILWVVVLFGVRAVQAQLFVVDQSATPDSQQQFVLLSGGVGQEFMPSFSSLDFIEVTLGSMDLNDTGTFQARVREENMGGNIVGLSDAVTVTAPGASGQVTRFVFPGGVTLSPGATYVFEIPHSGPFWGAAVGASSYDRGQSIQLSAGQWPENFDLWFRDGIVVVPEPTTWKLAAVGLVALAGWRRWKR